MSKYTVTYKYIDPSPAGPFKGKTVVDYRPDVGDLFWAVMGKATVTSVRKVATPSTDASGAGQGHA